MAAVSFSVNLPIPYNHKKKKVNLWGRGSIYLYIDGDNYENVCMYVGRYVCRYVGV